MYGNDQRHVQKELWVIINVLYMHIEGKFIFSYKKKPEIFNLGTKFKSNTCTGGIKIDSIIIHMY